MDDRLAAAFAAIDAANADDPNTIEVDSELRPKEQAHAELMTEWVRRLDPDATDAQLLAARAHHLRRWTSPRAGFPEGRAGYLRWRTALRKRHAQDVGELLAPLGYPSEVVARVQAIVGKEGLGRDPQVQVHEDALCLVFLQTQLDPVAEQLGDDKAVDVLRRTARKMSPAGLAAAGTIAYSEHGAALVARALADD